MPSSPAHPEHHLLLLLSAVPKYPTLCRAGGPLAQCEPSCRVFSRICSPWKFFLRTGSRCSNHLWIQVLLLTGDSFSAGVRLQDVRFNGIQLPCSTAEAQSCQGRGSVPGTGWERAGADSVSSSPGTGVFLSIM